MEQDVYRSSRTLSRWLVATLLLYMALDIAVSGTNAVVTLQHPEMFDEDAELSPGQVVAALVLAVGGIGAVLALVACVVLFCVWIRRANQNASALGARGMEFTPGWAAGWFFVPIANLFKPYQAMREIYQASDPDRDDESDEAALHSLHWSNEPAPTQMKLWWGTWILMSFLDNSSFRLSFRDDPASQAASAWLGAAGALVAIPCTVLVIWLVFEIDDRQARRHAMHSHPAPGAFPARAASPTPQ
jgi:hypothetical protein